MKYFKDPVSGEVFAFAADGSQDDFIPKNLKAMKAAEVDAHLNPQPTNDQLAAITKEVKANTIAKLTVTTQSGKVFKADEESISRMASAIMASDTTGIIEHAWKIADGSKPVITLNELKEAHALAIQALGQVVLSD